MRVMSTAPPKHLIKLMPTEAEQYAYCKSIGCYFECEWCVGYSESIPVPTTMPIKEKISQVRVTPTKYDNLSKIATNKGYKRNDHPLWDYIVNKLIDGE